MAPEIGPKSFRTFEKQATGFGDFIAQLVEDVEHCIGMAEFTGSKITIKQPEFFMCPTKWQLLTELSS